MMNYNEYQERLRILRDKENEIEEFIQEEVYKLRADLYEKFRRKINSIENARSKLEKEWQDICRTFTINERAVSVRCDCMAA